MYSLQSSSVTSIYTNSNGSNKFVKEVADGSGHIYIQGKKPQGKKKFTVDGRLKSGHSLYALSSDLSSANVDKLLESNSVSNITNLLGKKVARKKTSKKKVAKKKKTTKSKSKSKKKTTKKTKRKTTKRKAVKSKKKTSKKKKSTKTKRRKTTKSKKRTRK